MQVRYDATLFPVKPADGGGGDYLTNGAVYEVIEVHRSKTRTSFRIASDDEIPALFDARGFVTVDDSIPADWRVEATTDHVTLGPAQFVAGGFWEDYFDGNEMALELYERRKPTAAWSQLAQPDCRVAWTGFESRFGFRASMSPDQWPAIKEPAESLTFDLSPVFEHEGPRFAAAEDALNAEALRAFVGALPDEPLYALDWRHPTYRFSPARFALNPNPEWKVPVFPNGDYYAFFTSDFTTGTFGHPWEQSLCVIGERLIDTLGASLRTWLPLLREGGVDRASRG